MSFSSIDEAVCTYLDQGGYFSPKEFWVASMAGQCLRKQYLRKIGQPGKVHVNYSSRMQAYDGDGIHLKIQNIFRSLKILVEAEEAIVDMDYMFKGKPDAVIELAGGKCLLDIKTQNQKAWARRKEKGERIIDAHHRKQVVLYFYFLRKHKYSDLNSARIYYINRNTGEREEFEIIVSEADIKERLDELKILNEYFKEQVVPEMPHNLDDCYFCDYAEQCHKGAVPSKRYGRSKV